MVPIITHFRLSFLPGRARAGQGETRDFILGSQAFILGFTSCSGSIAVLLSLANTQIREFYDARIGEEMRLSSMSCGSQAKKNHQTHLEEF